MEFERLVQVKAASDLKEFAAGLNINNSIILNVVHTEFEKLRTFHILRI